jgi:hypothetical protein
MILGGCVTSKCTSPHGDKSSSNSGTKINGSSPVQIPMRNSPCSFKSTTTFTCLMNVLKQHTFPPKGKMRKELTNPSNVIIIIVLLFAYLSIEPLHEKVHKKCTATVVLVMSIVSFIVLFG